MKVITLIILMVQCFCLSAQTPADSVVIVHTGIDIVKENKEEIQALADSINNYDDGALPAFLLDSCFDAHSSHLWNGFHDAKSIRWTVLQLVKNKHALELLLNSNDARLKGKCNWQPENVYPHIVIPLVNVPVYELIKRRYKELSGH